MSVVIVAIVVMAIAVPVIAGAGISEKTMRNAGDYRATYADVSTGTTVISLAVNGEKLEVDGIEIGGVIGQGQSSGMPYMITSNGIICFYKYNDTTLRVSFRNIAGQNVGITDLTIGTDMSLQIIDGAVQKVSLIGNMEFEKIIVPNENGELVASNSARVSPGGICYWASIYQLESYNTGLIRSSGDPWEPSTITTDAYMVKQTPDVWSGSPSSVETSDIGKTAMTVGALVFDDPVLSTFSSAGLMYVPLEYTETSTGATGTVKTMVDMIPLLMIVGLTVATVAAYIKFRND